MADQRLQEPIGELKTKYQVYFWCIGSVVVLEHAGRLLLGIDWLGGIGQWLLGILSAQV